jgi:hypothetical protein
MQHERKFTYALCKSGFIVNQYDYKSELSDEFRWKSPICNFNNVWNDLWDMWKSLFMALCKSQPHDSVRVVRQENIAMGPEGAETKNCCASECQQQFTRPDKALCKQGFILDQYDWEQECPGNF